MEKKAKYCVPVSFPTCYFRYLPESIHWLVVNQRTKTLFRTVKAAARINGVTLPAGFVESVSSSQQLGNLLPLVEIIIVVSFKLRGLFFLDFISELKNILVCS